MKCMKETYNKARREKPETQRETKPKINNKKETYNKPGREKLKHTEKQNLQ